MKIVKIEWIDSTGDQNSWLFKEDMKPIPPEKCETVGFLLEDNEEYVTVAFSECEEQVCGRMTILKSCMKSMKELVPKAPMCVSGFK